MSAEFPTTPAIQINEIRLGVQATYEELAESKSALSQTCAGRKAEEIAQAWESGLAVSGIVEERSTTGRAQKFLRGYLLVVRIALSRLPLEVALQAEFTQRHATVACCSGDAETGELLLAFELTESVTDRQRFKRLLTGAEAMYAGAQMDSRLDKEFAPKGANPTSLVLGGKLGGEVLERLEILGKERQAIRKSKGSFVRSRIAVVGSDVIRRANGEQCELNHLQEGEGVYCPVHVDKLATAVVHWFGDGTPGVQCVHCLRTYAAKSTRLDYDFGFFDRRLRELAEAEKDATTTTAAGVQLSTPPVTYLAEPYLSPLSLEPGVTFVKSSKGTGKTEALVALVSEAKKRDLRVLVIGHRRALLQAISDRLGVTCYFVVDTQLDSAEAPTPTETLLSFGSDLPREKGEPAEPADGTARYQRVDPARRYAISLDSLWDVDPEQHPYEVVVIDEAEQVFAHLISDTLKERRREVYLGLVHYLRVAQSAYLLDADLGMVTLEMAFHAFRPETLGRFLVNEPIASPRDIHMYNDAGQLITRLLEHARLGRKIFVATNSKKKASELMIMLSEQLPALRVDLVTSENSQSEKVQSLLGDISNHVEHHADILISSPAIGTGIDISFWDKDRKPRTVVDSVFGFFEANIVTHFDIDQQLMRVRHPGEVHVWVNPAELFFETDPVCIRNELERSVRKTHFLLGYKEDGTRVYSDDGGLVKIWSHIVAASRGSKNRLSFLFRDLRSKAGWTPVDVEPDEDSVTVGRELAESAKKTRREERIEQILSAPQLEAEELDDLLKRRMHGLSLTPEELNSLERHAIENFYSDGEISLELIEFDDEGRTRGQVRRLECLISRVTWFEIEDERELNADVTLFDRRHHLPQREVFEVVLAATGLFETSAHTFRTDLLVEASALGPFVEAVKENRKRIESLFSVPMYGDLMANPIRQLQGILRLVGLRLELREMSQKGGGKARRYGIDELRLTRMVGAVRARDERYKRDEVERDQPKESNQSPKGSLRQAMEALILKSKAKGAESIPTQ